MWPVPVTGKSVRLISQGPATSMIAMFPHCPKYDSGEPHPAWHFGNQTNQTRESHKVEMAFAESRQQEIQGPGAWLGTFGLG